MPLIKVVGIDPSLSNTGLIKGELNTVTGVLSNLEIKLIETKPSKTKSVRKNSDDFVRAQTIHKELTAFIEGVNLGFVELPVGSQSARSMASYGICTAVMACLPLPLIQLTATEIKVEACGKKTASKADMINWATKLRPEVPWLTVKKKGIPTIVQKNEHLADALGAIYAGVKTDQFKQIISIYQNI